MRQVRVSLSHPGDAAFVLGVGRPHRQGVIAFRRGEGIQAADAVGVAGYLGDADPGVQGHDAPFQVRARSSTSTVDGFIVPGEDHVQGGHRDVPRGSGRAAPG